MPDLGFDRRLGISPYWPKKVLGGTILGVLGLSVTILAWFVRVPQLDIAGKKPKIFRSLDDPRIKGIESPNIDDLDLANTASRANLTEVLERLGSRNPKDQEIADNVLQKIVDDESGNPSAKTYAYLLALQARNKYDSGQKDRGIALLEKAAKTCPDDLVVKLLELLTYEDANRELERQPLPWSLSAQEKIQAYSLKINDLRRDLSPYWSTELVIPDAGRSHYQRWSVADLAPDSIRINIGMDSTGDAIQLLDSAVREFSLADRKMLFDVAPKISDIIIEEGGDAHFSALLSSEDNGRWRFASDTTQVPTALNIIYEHTHFEDSYARGKGRLAQVIFKRPGFSTLPSGAGKGKWQFAIDTDLQIDAEVRLAEAPKACCDIEKHTNFEELSNARAEGSGISRRALMVGINTYDDKHDHTDFQGLVYARRDAERIAQAFGGLGYNTTSLIDQSATRARIIATLARETLISKPGDNFVFYFSGHGFSDAHGRGALLTAGQGATETGVVSLGEIAQILSFHRGTVTVILDGCLTKRDVEMDGLVLGSGRLYGSNRVRFILAATPGGVALESQRLKSGLYTQALLKCLSREAATRHLDFEKLLAATSDETARLAQELYGLEQHPQSITFLGGGSRKLF